MISETPKNIIDSKNHTTEQSPLMPHEIEGATLLNPIELVGAPASVPQLKEPSSAIRAESQSAMTVKQNIQLPSAAVSKMTVVANRD